MLGVPEDPNEPAIRKDVNPTQYRHWKKSMIGEFEKYFGKYGADQVHLWILCAMPAFRGRGAETRLARWGLEHASRAGVSIATVLVTAPKSKPIYEQVGYQGRGSFTIHIEGEEASMEVWPMERAP